MTNLYAPRLIVEKTVAEKQNQPSVESNGTKVFQDVFLLHQFMGQKSWKLHSNYILWDQGVSRYFFIAPIYGTKVLHNTYSNTILWDQGGWRQEGQDREKAVQVSRDLRI